MNQTQTAIRHRKMSFYGFTAAGLLIALLTSGCFGNYGRLKHNDDVTRAFKAHQVEPNYRYYYYGRTNMPYAIVGIDR